MASLLRRIQEKFEDAQGSKKSSNDELPADVRGGAQASGLRSKEREKEKEKENKHIAAYLSLCEKQWSEMTKQAFNNTEMLNNIEALVNRLYQYCSNSRDSWRESERDLNSLCALKTSITSLSEAIGVAIEKAHRVEASIVPAMEKKNEDLLEQMKAKADEDLASNDRQFTKNVNRLKAQHESFAQEVAQSQSSYNAVQQAADEIRSKLLASSSQEPQYQNLNDVQLDIKIDKKYRVKDID